MISAVNVQTRNCEVDDLARAHFEEKLHALERLWSREADAKVRIRHERGLFAAEITLFADGLTTRAEERAHDLRSAFDAALHKLEGQLRRYKEKVQQRSRRQNNRDDVSGTVMNPVPAPGLTAPATVAALDTNTQNGQSQENHHEDKMVRVKKFALKPMAAEEAVLQMDLLGHDFFVFRDDENNQVSVVYRRSGGGYGLIEPVPD